MADLIMACGRPASVTGSSPSLVGLRRTPSSSSSCSQRRHAESGANFGPRIMRTLPCSERLRSAHSPSSSLLRFPPSAVQAGGVANGWRGASGSAAEMGGRRRRRPRATEDDFEVEDDGGFDVDAAEVDEDEEEDFRDYETEYESPTEYRPLQRDMESFSSTEGEVEETVVGWKINEEEFHKFSLLTCDFFIRKVPDPDDDVYDFREMYVTPPDTDIYSIPKVEGNLPKKPVRCSPRNYEYIHTTEPPVDEPRSPMYKTDMEVMKIFLMKHLRDRRAEHEHFCLDFEEIYVIDSRTKSFSRAEVKVDVPGGKDRDRNEEVLIVRDDGTSFLIIPEESKKTPDQIIQEKEWTTTREAMENYLRGFRDYETSNWF